MLLEGFGHTRVPDGAPVGPDTPFLIASLSKPLTASAVMQLVEAGAIDLDEPVSTYLPELRPGGDAVAVRDLLLAVALWMPTMFDSTLTAALDFPDLRILLIAAGIGLTWGAIRAAVVGAALLRRAGASRSAFR